MSGQEFPRGLFFDARDRADLRPAEYSAAARAPQGVVGAAAVKLRDEVERRSRLMGRTIRDLEQAARAVKQLRDMDAAGFGDTWVDFAEAVRGRADTSFQALLAAVDAAYERHDEMRDLAAAGRDPEMVELETAAAETEDPDSDRGEEPMHLVVLAPGQVVPTAAQILDSPPNVHFVPSPADIARQVSQQRVQALGHWGAR